MIDIQVSKVGRCYLHMTDGVNVAACPDIDFDKTTCIRNLSGNNNARLPQDWPIIRLSDTSAAVANHV
jgi:hypothetical protein